MSPHGFNSGFAIGAGFTPHCDGPRTDKPRKRLHSSVNAWTSWIRQHRARCSGAMASGRLDRESFAAAIQVGVRRRGGERRTAAQRSVAALSSSAMARSTASICSCMAFRSAPCCQPADASGWPGPRLMIRSRAASAISARLARRAPRSARRFAAALFSSVIVDSRRVVHPLCPRQGAKAPALCQARGTAAPMRPAAASSADDRAPRAMEPTSDRARGGKLLTTEREAAEWNGRTLADWLFGHPSIWPFRRNPLAERSPFARPPRDLDDRGSGIS